LLSQHDKNKSADVQGPVFLAGWVVQFYMGPKKRTHLPHYFLVLRREKRTHVPQKKIRLLRLSIRPIIKDLIIILLYNCFGVNLEAVKCIPSRDRSHQNARFWLVLTTETNLIYFIAKGKSTIRRNHCPAFDLCKSIELAGFLFCFPDQQVYFTRLQS
jgi:hypothetical protein